MTSRESTPTLRRQFVSALSIVSVAPLIVMGGLLSTRVVDRHLAQAELAHDVNFLYTLFGIAAVVIVGVALLAANWLATRIAAPLQMLSSALNVTVDGTEWSESEKASVNDVDLQRARSSKDAPSEILLLAEHIATMRSRIEKSDAMMRIVLARRDGEIEDRTRLLAATNQTLAEREQRLAQIYNSVLDVMFLLRIDRSDESRVQLRFEFVNAAFLDITGCAANEVTDNLLSEILPPSVGEEIEARCLDVVRWPRTLQYDDVCELPAGRATTEVTLTALTDTLGAVTHVLCIQRDVTAARRSFAAIQQSEARYRGVLENLRGPAVQLDVDGMIVFANEALAQATGWSREEMIGRSWFTHFSGHKEERLPEFYEIIQSGIVPAHHESEVCTRSGERRLVAWDNVVVRDIDGAISGTASVGQDVTERRQLERRLASLSEHDDLTGLLNRRGFFRVAGQELKHAKRYGRTDGVLFVDLDRFKPINDSHGHAAGDDALRAISRVLLSTMRETDVVARLGGDEFAIYAIAAETDQINQLIRRLRAALGRHNTAAGAAGRPYRIEISIGSAIARPDDELDQLLSRSDSALYAEKAFRKSAIPA